MRNFRKISFFCIKIAAILMLAFFCLTETEAVSRAVAEALERCLIVIIPSLYGMMIASAMLTGSGITSRLPNAINSFGRLIFGMNGCVFPIFLFSMFAGYPIGAKMLISETNSGSIPRREAELYSGVCFGAGPAFIFGCISSQLYSGSSAGKLILISSVFANVILALALSVRTRKSASLRKNPPPLRLDAQLLTESIVSAGRSMASICTMIIAFAVFTQLLSSYGAVRFSAEVLSQLTGLSFENAEGLILAFLDITNVSRLPHNNYALLPVLSALVSFGGVCVIMQISALTSGCMNIRPLILLRCIAALLSGALCKLLMPFFLATETVSVSGMRVSVCHESSPVPSIILIIMTFILFVEYEKLCSSSQAEGRKFR